MRPDDRPGESYPPDKELSERARHLLRALTPGHVGLWPGDQLPAPVRDDS